MGMDVESKLRLVVGSMKDQASIGKALLYYHDGFSDIEISVVRATFHGNTSLSNDKYVHEILFLVSENQESILFLAQRLTRRLGKTKDHLVALKTLVLIHRLLRGGNRGFEQKLRGAHSSGHLQMITHRLQDSNPNPLYNFLRKYAAYLEERMDWFINQAGKLEPVMPQPVSEFRDLDREEKTIGMVVHRLRKCLQFLDRVMDCSPCDILSADGLVITALSSILKESFKVYINLWDCVATLVNVYFDLSKPARILTCDLLKVASKQSQELRDFYSNCRRIVEHRHLDYPSVHIITIDHVLALEQLNSTPSTAHRFMVTSPAGSSPQVLLDCLSKSCEMLTVTKRRQSEKIEEFAENTSLPTLFSCKMETKISKVWVVFDEEEPIKTHASAEMNCKADLSISGQQTSCKVATYRAKQHNKPCKLLTSSATSIDLSMVSRV